MAMREVKNYVYVPSFKHSNVCSLLVQIGSVAEEKKNPHFISMCPSFHMKNISLDISHNVMARSIEHDQRLPLGTPHPPLLP